MQKELKNIEQATPAVPSSTPAPWINLSGEALALPATLLRQHTRARHASCAMKWSR